MGRILQEFSTQDLGEAQSALGEQRNREAGESLKRTMLLGIQQLIGDDAMNEDVEIRRAILNECSPCPSTQNDEGMKLGKQNLIASLHPGDGDRFGYLKQGRRSPPSIP